MRAFRLLLLSPLFVFDAAEPHAVPSFVASVFILLRGGPSPLRVAAAAFSVSSVSFF